MEGGRAERPKRPPSQRPPPPPPPPQQERPPSKRPQQPLPQQQQQQQQRSTHSRQPTRPQQSQQQPLQQQQAPSGSKPFATSIMSGSSGTALHPPTKNVEINGGGVANGAAPYRTGNDGSLSSVKSLTTTDRDRSDDWVEINDDVYNMFFLSNVCGQAFWYAIYIFVLKLTLYTFLALDAIDLEQPDTVTEKVLVTQFFMLPVAVAMQDDLIATYFLVANIKYSPLIKMQCPEATKWKFHVANLCRGIDGMYSLFVNFIVLMKATEVLPLFLNFAALQFLQTIDNIALRLCADGYLTERLEEVSNNVMTVKLPNKNNPVYRSMDSILFLSTFAALLIAWAVISFV